MRRSLTTLSLLLLAVTSSCSQSTRVSQGAVNETYLHRYGVAVSKAEWESAGRTGSVISTQPDGRTVTQHFRGGVLDGETIYTFPHSQAIERSVTYHEGNITREVWNYESGMPKNEKRWDSPDKLVLTSWYESGVPKSVEEFHNDQLITGNYLTQTNETESKVADGDGTRIARDDWGQLLSNDKFKGGELTSRTTFHPNGSPKEVIPYKHGKIAGVKRTFTPNGEPRTVEQWANNKQEGLTTIFKNGEKASEVAYVKGKRHGIEKRYTDAGELAEEVNWLNGTKHGVTKVIVDGTERNDYYHRGKLVSESVYRELNSHVR